MNLQFRIPKWSCQRSEISSDHRNFWGDFLRILYSLCHYFILNTTVQVSSRKDNVLVKWKSAVKGGYRNPFVFHWPFVLIASMAHNIARRVVVVADGHLSIIYSDGIQSFQVHFIERAVLSVTET